MISFVAVVQNETFTLNWHLQKRFRHVHRNFPVVTGQSGNDLEIFDGPKLETTTGILAFSATF